MKLHQVSWVLKERLLSKNLHDWSQIFLFISSLSFSGCWERPVHHEAVCISMQCAVCSMWLRVGRNKKLFVYLWKWPRRLWLGTVRLLTNQHSFMSISSSEGSRTTNKRCCRDPHFQRRLRFGGDKEVINAIYFLFNYRAQPHSRIHLRCSEPAVLNCPPTRIYSHVWLIAGRQDQTKRARDNELASEEETPGILSVSTKWTSVNEVEKWAL